MNSTYTYATLAVAKTTYEDVKERLIEATKHEVPPRSFGPDEDLDMHGIALVVDWGKVAAEKAEKVEKASKRKPRKLLKSEEWAAAVQKGQDSIATIRTLLEGTLTTEFETLLSVFEDLSSRKDDYSERLGNIPESLQQGENAERLRAIDEIDLGDSDENPLEAVMEALSAFEEVLNECENADLPKD